jgi:hypothetical protein
MTNQQILENLLNKSFDVETTLSRMAYYELPRVKRAMKEGKFPSTSIRHYCHDFGITYRQGSADRCLEDAIGVATKMVEELRPLVYEYRVRVALENKYGIII